MSHAHVMICNANKNNKTAGLRTRVLVIVLATVARYTKKSCNVLQVSPVAYVSTAIS